MKILSHIGSDSIFPYLKNVSLHELCNLEMYISDLICFHFISLPISTSYGYICFGVECLLPFNSFCKWSPNNNTWTSLFLLTSLQNFLTGWCVSRLISWLCYFQRLLNILIMKHSWRNWVIWEVNFEAYSLALLPIHSLFLGLPTHKQAVTLLVHTCKPLPC